MLERQFVPPAVRREPSSHDGVVAQRLIVRPGHGDGLPVPAAVLVLPEGQPVRRATTSSHWCTARARSASANVRERPLTSTLTGETFAGTLPAKTLTDL